MQPLPKLQVNEVNTYSMIRMAIPISLGYVGIMMMNTVDLIVVGRIGALEMAAVGLGNIFWSIVFMPGMGTSIGMEFPVAFNFGAKRHTECRRVMIQGLWIVTIYSAVMLVLPLLFLEFLRGVIADKQQAELAIEYFKLSLWGIWPALVFTIGRVYLQALGKSGPAFWVLLWANILNLVLDLGLILGYWGLPKMGVQGAAYATNFSRYFMMAALLFYILAIDKRMRVLVSKFKIQPSRTRMAEILRLGLPSGLQVAFEGGVFSVATILAASFDVVSSAAHQAVLNLAANAFMVPLGISSAAAVMVGQSYGRGNATDLKRAGRLGFQLALFWMLGSSLLFLVFPSYFLGLYTNDPHVIQAGAGLMLVAAAFQISDGIQVVGTGVLRGIGDTKSSMYANLIGHWAIGFPLSLFFAYVLHFKVQGIWMGLAWGLSVVAITLFVLWTKQSSRIVASLRGEEASQ